MERMGSTLERVVEERLRRQGTPRECDSERSTDSSGRESGATGPTEMELRVQAILASPEYQARMRELDEREAEARRRRVASRVPELLAKSGIPQKAREARLAEVTALSHQKAPLHALRTLFQSFRSGSRDWWLVLQGLRGGHGENPGANGIGKSFLAGVFGAEVCRLGCPVEFWPEYKLSNTLYRAMKPDTKYSVGDIVERLSSASALILDNMGTDGDFRDDGRVAPVSEFVREKLAAALDTCMEAPIPVLITTTLMPDEFEARYGHDIYSRVYGMCAKRSTWVPFSGPDLRKEWGE